MMNALIVATLCSVVLAFALASTPAPKRVHVYAKKKERRDLPR